MHAGSVGGAAHGAADDTGGHVTGPLIIAGSRGFSRDVVTDTLRLLANPSTVFSGACHGPDTWGAQWAASRGVQVREFPADWERLGPAAGPTRNAEMAKECHRMRGSVLVFWDGFSRGTLSLIRESQRLGLPLVIVRPTL